MTIKFYQIPKFSVFKVKRSQSVKSTRNCKLACSGLCTFCNRAVTKERNRSLQFKSENKICQRCLLRKSLSFCPRCHQCPPCYQKSTCGRSATVWALPGFKSEDSVHTRGRVHPISFKVRPPLTRSPLIVGIQTRSKTSI